MHKKSFLLSDTLWQILFYMSRENTKIDFFIKIWYNKIMKSTPLDIIIWETAQKSHLDDSTKKCFEFYFQNQKVGKCSVRFCQNAYGIYGENQFFPDCWFCEEKHFIQFFGKSTQLKPFLEITNLDFSDFQGKGFGRMGLQTMYRLSEELGAEGRIFLTARKRTTSLREPAPFYEHCGFKGNEGSEGGKYFEPTPENIDKLFSKPIHPLFRAQEVSTAENENSIVDSQTGQIKVPQKLKKILSETRTAQRS